MGPTSSPPTDPPCSLCRPELLPVNVPAVEVYRLLSGQMQYLPSGIATGLRFEAVGMAVEQRGPGLDIGRFVLDVMTIGNVVANELNKLKVKSEKLKVKS